MASPREHLMRHSGVVAVYSRGAVLDVRRTGGAGGSRASRSAAPNKRSVYRKSTLKLWVLSRRRSCRVRAPFFADFASGRRPISKKPIAGFVTAREHLCDKIPHEKPPRHTTRHCGTKVQRLVRSRHDGPGSGAVQHGDGSAGAPPRGVAIGARIERTGCCAAPLARRSSSTSRDGHTRGCANGVASARPSSRARRRP